MKLTAQVNHNYENSSMPSSKYIGSKKITNNREKTGKHMAEYKHNHLLFLSDPLVEPDNNLCERKARILKGKINHAISLRSFEHLIYFCEYLSVLDHFAADSKGSLYQSVKEVFGRQKPIRSKSEKSESA